MRLDEVLAPFKGEEKTAIHNTFHQITSILNARLKIFVSYKIWVLVELLNSVVSIAIYYFFGVMVEPEELEASGYGDSLLLLIVLHSFLIATAQFR